MGIVLLFVALLIVAYIMLRNPVSNSDEAIGVLCWIVGGIGLGASILFMLIFYCEGIGNLVEYEQDKAKFELACDNPNLTAMERSEAINLAVQDNYIILKNRIWRNNFWVGWFVYDAVGDLELFDLGRIPHANQLITAELNGVLESN